MSRERRLCGATNRQGQPCRALAMHGRQRCKNHGGKTPVGPASPHWIDGRHSRVLPKRLLAAAQASLADPERLSLVEELAVIDARTNDVLGRVDTGESGRLWRDLRRAWSRFVRARRSGDTAEMALRLGEVGDLIAQGHGDWAAWADVLGLFERRRRLVESERKHLIEAQQMVSVEHAVAVLYQLVDAVKRQVADPAVIRAVTEEFARLTGRPSPTESPDWHC